MKYFSNSAVLVALLLAWLLPASVCAETQNVMAVTPEYSLQVTVDHGTVTSTPAGIQCGSNCSHNYTGQTTVTLTAAAKTGYTFTGWSESTCGESHTCTVTMTGEKTVSATFSKNMYNLTVSIPEASTGSGLVKSSSSDIRCGSDCSEAYEHGKTVILTATADSGSTFYGWSGDCAGTSTCMVTMDDVKNVGAIFVTKDSPVLAGELNAEFR